MAALLPPNVNVANPKEPAMWLYITVSVAVGVALLAVSTTAPASTQQYRPVAQGSRVQHASSTWPAHGAWAIPPKPLLYAGPSPTHLHTTSSSATGAFGGGSSASSMATPIVVLAACVTILAAALQKAAQWALGEVPTQLAIPLELAEPQPMAMLATAGSKPTPIALQKSQRKSTASRAVATGDYPYPSQVKQTENFRQAAALSSKFLADAKDPAIPKKKVAIIGGGLSGLACAKYLSDAGHQPTVYEARNVLGGKVSAWQDADGDWIETGLHIFFGAYPNVMNLFEELGIEDRLQWKIHQMIFAMQELPGEFTTFDFVPGIPAPLNFALAILMNDKMLSLSEKLQCLPALLPMLVEGQEFIDRQDELSCLEFMRKYGMPERINTEVFISMAKALDFIDPDKLSMVVVLTAMNRFLNETDGLQMAFLDGNQPERLCQVEKEWVEKKGGKVYTGTPIAEIVTNDDGSVKHLRLRNGEIVVADEYVSAMPVDVFKRYIPEAWSTMPFFRQVDELEGIPVINLHMWFDRKLKQVNHLCFSRSPLLSVYADMSTTCKEYYDPECSMLELVFAPCSPLAGGNVNWMSKTDEEIIDATMGELARLFPLEIAADERWPSTKNQGPQGQARLRKYAVVRTPRSVYAAIPGRNKFRPTQLTPISNFTLAGDWTTQKFLGSMEGATLGGKLAAEVVCDRAAGRTYQDYQCKAIQPQIEQGQYSPKRPLGVMGAIENSIAWGGGMEVASKRAMEEMVANDPAQGVKGQEYVGRV